IAGWLHCPHQCPCNCAPQFLQCVSGGRCVFRRWKNRLRALEGGSSAEIAVSPKMSFVTSSATSGNYENSTPTSIRNAGLQSVGQMAFSDRNIGMFPVPCGRKLEIDDPPSVMPRCAPIELSRANQ